MTDARQPVGDTPPQEQGMIGHLGSEARSGGNAGDSLAETQPANNGTNLANAEESAWGYQMILDCFGCSEEICCDLDNGYEFLDQVCNFLHMTKQTQPYIFKTCDKTFPGRPGYSGWVPIIESGIQIHTSAKNRFVSVDVYSCKTFDLDSVQEFVRQWFSPTTVEYQFFYRGRDFLKRSFGSDSYLPAKRSTA